MSALQDQANALLRLRCARCGSGEIPVGRDDHPHLRGFSVLAPKLFACSGPPHRWYGPVVAVFCSPGCGMAWQEGQRVAA